MRFFILIGIVVIGFSSNVTMLKQLDTFLSKSQDILGTGVDVAVGSAKALPKYLSPSQLLDLGKQSIIGYPVELLLSAINAICSAAQSTDAIHSKDVPDKTKIFFLLMTPCKNYSYPIDQAVKMWENPAFRHDKKVILLTTGWKTNINQTDTISAMSKAYFCRGDVNFIAVDTASLVDTLYSWSALNTEGIGELIGTGLSLLKDKIAPEKIHLIGHSLGAHIVGAAGRTFHKLTNEYVGRITGLDPARPCFNEGEKLSGLMRGDALYVDVIHSNPGNLGKREPIGDADFYPGGLQPLISGCYDVICSHSRAWELYIESVYPGQENNFPAMKCSSQTQLLVGSCGQSAAVPMGYSEKEFNTKGNFFLQTNSRAPYGRSQGIPVDPMCGNCKKSAELF